MTKYLFVYHGGKAPADPSEIKKVMDAWGSWFGSMGSAVIDGVGKSSTVKSDGSLTDGGGANPASGYSLIEAASLQEAHQKASGCPILKSGGTIEIAPTLDM
jgi:hypothetical protein